MARAGSLPAEHLRAEAPALTSAPGRSSLVGPVLLVVVFSVVFTLVGSVSIGGHRYFTLFDDGMISMRYAANLAHGHGLVWNAGGARVEGYTNFLWTLWMAALHLVPGVPAAERALLVVVSCVGLLVANLWLVRAVAEQLAPDRPMVGRAALWLTASSFPLLYWSLRGMEVGLLAVVTTAMALVVLRWRDGPSTALLRAFVVLAAVAILTRTDAAIPVVVAATFLVAWTPPARRVRTGVAVASAIGFIVGVHTGFRLWYYGDPLPNTYYLKLGGAPLAARLSRGMVSISALACASLLAPLALAATHVARRRRVEPGVALLLALFLFPAAYSVYVGGDAWEWLQFANRYLATGLTLLFVVAGLGVCDLISAVPRQRYRAAAAGAALALGGLAVAVFELLPTGSLQYSLRQVGDVSLRELVALCSLLLLGLWVVRSARLATASGAALVAAAAVLTNGQGFVTWAQTSGLHVTDDNTMAIYGLELRQATSPRASIAVVWAGAAPYFDGRPAIDLLGKSDRHIAKEPMRTGVSFYPGHTKWDYAWSIGHLRPDVVAGLVRPTPSDLADLDAWGYDQLRPGVFIRRSSIEVDRTLLTRLLDSTPRVEKLIDRDL